MITLFQAILCDDNEIILEGLETQINWTELGISLAGTASNGNEALSLIQSIIPDILITDIRMPFLDGLKLTAKAKELNNNIVIIFISGYNDFEYARAAVQLGTIDYILKPINPNELVKALKTAIEHCQQIYQGQYMNQMEIIRDILYCDVSLLSVTERCISKHFDSEMYCCVMRIEMNDNELASLSSNSRLSAEIRFSRLLEQLTQTDIYIVERELSKCMLFLCNKFQKRIHELQDNIINMVRHIYFSEENNYDVVIASGNIYKGIFNGSKTMGECNRALKLRFIKGINATIFYNEVQEYSQAYDCRHEIDNILDIDFLTPVKNQDKKVLEERLRLLRERLKEKGGNSYLYMTLTIGGIYTGLMKELGEAGIDISEVFDDPIEEFQKVTDRGTLDAVIENLQQSLFKICTCIKTNKSRYGKIIENAFKYMHTHYKQSTFSIEEVASAISMSTSYFSTIFKHQTGSTFTDYLIKIRMNKAMELLTHTNLKIYEVSFRIGYDNAAYFSAAFKRYTGLSPSEYQSLNSDFGN
jgi:two-component system response regulator YesN